MSNTSVFRARRVNFVVRDPKGTDKEYQRVLSANVNIGYALFKRETGASGNVHLQGCMKLLKQTNSSVVAKYLESMDEILSVRKVRVILINL